MDGEEVEGVKPVAGSSDIVPVPSTPTTPEQQYYRELLGGFFATLTRWQAILADEQFLFYRGGTTIAYPGTKGMTNGEYRGIDVITTAKGTAIIRERPTDKYSSRRSDPDLILNLSSKVEVDIPEWDSYGKRFLIVPGPAGQHEFIGPDGEPIQSVAFRVNKAEFVGYTQWLSIQADNALHMTQAVDYETHNGIFQRKAHPMRGFQLMSNAYASHVFQTIDALIPGTPVVPQQPK